MQLQNIGILGAGALGLMFGKKLSMCYGDDRVKFIADKNRKSVYQKNGFMINNKPYFPSIISNLDNKFKLDLLIVALKANALISGLELVKKLVSQDTIIISLMNGVTSEEIIAKELNLKPLMLCVTQGMDATKVGNKLTYTQVGVMVIGEANSSHSPRFIATKTCLNKAGICVQEVENIKLHQWSKFMLNCGVNQLLAIRKAPYELIQTDQKERNLMIEIMNEVRVLANQMGINLSKSDITKWLNIVDTLSPKCYPSMTQDILARRKSEVGIFAKTAIELGRKFGVLTPLNAMLYDEIMKLEYEFS